MPSLSTRMGELFNLMKTAMWNPFMFRNEWNIDGLHWVWRLWLQLVSCDSSHDPWWLTQDSDLSQQTIESLHDHEQVPKAVGRMQDTPVWNHLGGMSMVNWAMDGKGSHHTGRKPASLCQETGKHLHPCGSFSNSSQAPPLFASPFPIPKPSSSLSCTSKITPLLSSLFRSCPTSSSPQTTKLFPHLAVCPDWNIPCLSSPGKIHSSLRSLFQHHISRVFSDPIPCLN